MLASLLGVCVDVNHIDNLVSTAIGNDDPMHGGLRGRVWFIVGACLDERNLMTRRMGRGVRSSECTIGASCLTVQPGTRPRRGIARAAGQCTLTSCLALRVAANC